MPNEAEAMVPTCNCRNNASGRAPIVADGANPSEREAARIHG
jgi:hypothetical protein